ncbi:hypothetical protein AB0J57_34500 [Streptomyces sp. NPDC049837]|uniref:hypothetical protein n=1 Tax=Streptomyces sp. NPDC049837 TaxID=3155277 RepID=UPI00343D1452
MTHEEKRAWIIAVLALGTYAVYLAVILTRAAGTPVAEVSYAPPLLWAVGISIAASIVLSIAVSIGAPKDAGRRDQRDREIHRFGEYVGQSFVVLGGVAALALALAEVNHFWIANAIYAGFTLSAIVGCAAKLAAYRWGFQPW